MKRLSVIKKAVEGTLASVKAGKDPKTAAYMPQELKKALAINIRNVLKKYGMTGSVAVLNHSKLVVTLAKGKLDLIGDRARYNTKHNRDIRSDPFQDTYFQTRADIMARNSLDPKIAKFYEELDKAMRGDTWYDKSDPMTDHFDTAYYLQVYVGKWDKPYIYLG